MTVPLGQQVYMLQLQQHNKSTQHVCCIDNLAVLADKVSVLVGMCDGGASVK